MAAVAATVSLTPAAAQGPIGTVPRGAYQCELPGDAAGSVGQPQPEANFTIESASRYTSAQGGGTYLRRGDTLQMTSGPRQGESYAIVSEGFLRRYDNGKPGRLRCVLSG
jgi:hypothetical protein